ncbi:MAG TPA: hypothetical protein PKW21_15505, partial [Rhabdaerophilum sp.]|nr:hypothetical protein [Rhabdaerophilum sp.]
MQRDGAKLDIAAVGPLADIDLFVRDQPAGLEERLEFGRHLAELAAGDLIGDQFPHRYAVAEKARREVEDFLGPVVEDDNSMFRI